MGCNMVKIHQVILMMMIFVSQVSYAQIKVIGIRKSKKIIVRISEDEFISKGDTLLIENNRGKCLAQVLKVIPTKALVSTKQCHFKIAKGDNATYIDNKMVAHSGRHPSSKDDTFKDIYFEFKAGIDINISIDSEYENSIYDGFVTDSGDIITENKKEEKGVSLDGNIFMYLSKRREIDVEIGFVKSHTNVVTIF